MTHDEARVLDRARSGDPHAVTELYQRFGRDVYRIALRLTASPADAEDVLQDVFVGLPKALHSYRGRGSLEGWVRRVATRTALMRLRVSKRRREVSLDALPASPAVDVPVADQIDLEQGLALMPLKLRAVFVLREIEGYSHVEIGEMMGITPNVSKIRLHRARRWLRRLLEDR